MTDQNASLAWDRVALPFGETWSEAGPRTTSLRFAGQVHDPETGLHHNYFRDYDPTTGRYVESDPIGLEGGINTYAYVLGNPLVYYDRYGLESYLYE
jgi:RHS repeat-associated protein